MAKKKVSTANNSKKEKVEKEEVCEIFEVEKDGKEKEIKACGIEEEKKPSEEQIKKEKKIFIGIGIAMACFILFFVAVYFIMNSFNNFEVDGVKFIVDKTAMAGKTLYRTSLPVIYNGTKANYNFYLRNDPRKTNDNIPFNGEIILLDNVVLNQKSNFACNGDYIGIANLIQLYNAVGTKVISDQNASCDNQGRYLYVNIQEGNETNIEQVGPACYNINVKDCEILPVTEKMMIETLSYINKRLKTNN